MEREYFSIHGYNPLRLDVDEETGWRCELPCSQWVGGVCEGWLEGQAVWGPAGAERTGALQKLSDVTQPMAQLYSLSR